MSIMTEVSAAIERLRARLLEAGYQHTHKPGELVRVDDSGNSIFVRTGYTHGAYRVTAMGRRNGSRVGQCYIDIAVGTSRITMVDELAGALATAQATSWPPHPAFTPSQTGWGEGVAC